MVRLIFIPALVLLLGCVDQTRDVAEAGSPSGQAAVTGSTSTGANSATAVQSNAQELSPKLKVLTNVGENIILPAYQLLRDEAASFVSAESVVSEYCAAIGTDAEFEKFTQTLTRLEALGDSIQAVEVMLVGPLVTGGSGLHNRIHPYSEFQLASCSLDQAVVSHTDGDYDIEIRASNQKGFPAIEYLLANTNLEHTCPAQVPATQKWNDLAAQAQKTQRCNLALTIASDLSLAAQQAYDAWSPANGNYLAEFTAEENVGDNFQALSDALFYIEKNTKSRKLTVPLGLDSDCSATTCGELVESPYLGSSLRNIVKNLETFLLVFDGGEGFGFDDVIDEAGFPEVSRRFRDQVLAAKISAEANTATLAEQVQRLQASNDSRSCVNAFANPTSIEADFPACALAGLVKRVTDDLKIDFVTIVEVSIPGNVQSDND